MLSILIMVASVLVYLAMSFWTAGFICARCTCRFDDPVPWMFGFFWPLSLSFLGIKTLMMPVFHRGSQDGEKLLQKLRIRVVHEQRIRIEQELIQSELDTLLQLNQSQEQSHDSQQE
jgi:hypothetical protein